MPCECPHDDAKACVHECSICLKALTLKDSEGMCWLCEDYLETVPKDYPDDTAEATTHGAVYALILRIQANNCREAADDADDAEEKRDCLRDAKRLDARASALLYESSGSFKPWWFNRWDYWMQPGSTQEVPAWAEPVPVAVAAPVATPCVCPGHTTPAGIRYKHRPFCATSAPCNGCTIVNGSHVGTCWSEALATGSEPPSIERLPCGIQYAAPAPKAQPLPEPEYGHALWPSPRPKLFAKACAPDLKPMKHQEALVFLANRANITVDELRQTDPSKYAEKYMTSVPECWRAMIGRRPWWYNGPSP
jgi:hypothetical protein